MSHPAARRRFLGLGVVLVLLALGRGPAASEDGEDARGGAEIKNPYFKTTEWKVWRDDDSPVKGITSLVREGKKKKPVEITLEAPAKSARVYPVDPPQKAGKGPYIAFKKSARASRKYAGMWDDVYSSWSGLHGYVRPRWRAPDGSNVPVRGHIMDFVDVKQSAMMRAGVNFIHQSTTGMGHCIANGCIPKRTLGFEQLYFADVLVTAPAHASLTDHRADYSTDLYTAHVPTLFNSVGSSNSETMAITKMAIVGSYLPPAIKLRLKRHGLYPAALLYIWKAALPYDEPYAHELRHRISYKAVGDRVAYGKVEKYGATALDRGDMSLAFHCYDDAAHMRAMVDIARSMDVALPEAVFSVEGVKGESSGGYRLRKSAVVIQGKGKDVTIDVSTAGCYDVQDLPLTTRWKLLYGNKQTTVERSPDDPARWVIKVPWDDALPEGRTAIALIVNNGRFDSNPAILTVYRQKGDDLPPTGMGPKDYRWPGTFSNRRPILLGLQDRYVKRGAELAVTLDAVDPEGLPVSFYKRGADVGTLDGNRFTWRCPKKEAKGAKTVTLIASDATGGSSYGGEAFTIHINKPAVLAQIDIDALVGKAPLWVKVSGKPSIGRRLEYAWDFYVPSYKRKAKPFEDMKQGREATHTFDKPGIYEIALAVQGPAGGDTETIRVLVTPEKRSPRAADLRIEGNGVLIREGDEAPGHFDHTDFGNVPTGGAVVRMFRVVNGGDAPLRLDGKKAVRLGGATPGAFKITRQPRRRIDPRGSAWFEVRYKSKEAGTHQATLQIVAGSKTHAFTIAGTAVAP